MTKHTTEVWGLRRPDGTVLLSGYSGTTLRSEEHVRSEFDKSLFDQGFRPVKIRTITTTITEHL